GIRDFRVTGVQTCALPICPIPSVLAAPTARCWLDASDRSTGRAPGPVRVQGGGMTERDVDLALVERVRRGERHAFDLLVIKYQRKIMRLLSRMIHDQAEI